jgi:hypothetical protein
LEYFQLQVDDRARKIGGLQRISTPYGYFISLNVIQGLPQFSMRPPTDQELDTLPDVILTSDLDRDPASLDNDIDPLETDWYPSILFDDPYGPHPFDHRGFHQQNAFQSILMETVDIVVSNTTTQPLVPDDERLCPKFGWCSIDTIKHTFANTTQFARSLHLYGSMRKHYKSRFPAFNVSRRCEPVATDTIYAGTPAIDNGSRWTPIFFGLKTLVTDIYGMKTDKEFVSVIEDNIRYHDAMSQLISNRALAEICRKVKDILRAYHSNDWQSELHHRLQNFA